MGIVDRLNEAIQDYKEANSITVRRFEEAKKEREKFGRSQDQFEIALSGVAKVPQSKSNYRFSTAG